MYYKLPGELDNAVKIWREAYIINPEILTQLPKEIRDVVRNPKNILVVEPKSGGRAYLVLPGPENGLFSLHVLQATGTSFRNSL